MYLTMIPANVTTTHPTALALDASTEEAPTMIATEFAEEWNGFAVPAVTAATLRQYVAERAATDPNGLWRPEGVREAWVDVDGNVLDDEPEDDDVPVWPVLTYDDGEHDEPDVWHAVASDTGAPLADDAWGTLYLIDGWTWERQAVAVPARRVTVAGRISPAGARVVTEDRVTRAATLTEAMAAAESDPRAAIVAVWERTAGEHPEDTDGPEADYLWAVAGAHGVDPSGIVLDATHEEV